MLMAVCWHLLPLRVHIPGQLDLEPRQSWMCDIEAFKQCLTHCVSTHPVEILICILLLLTDTSKHLFI